MYLLKNFLHNAKSNHNVFINIKVHKFSVIFGEKLFMIPTFYSEIWLKQSVDHYAKGKKETQRYAALRSA